MNSAGKFSIKADTPDGPKDLTSEEERNLSIRYARLLGSAMADRDFDRRLSKHRKERIPMTTRTMMSEDPKFFTCTAETPWVRGGPTPVIHPDAIEGKQHDGWPAGDYVDMRCPHCGHNWEKELPQ